jgi:hypothetical protein
MQSNSDVLTTAFGGGTVTGSAGEFKFTPASSGTNEERSIVIEFTDGDVTYRYIFARVQVEGEVTFTLTRSGAVTYPIKFGVLAATPAYEILTNDEAFAAPAAPAPDPVVATTKGSTSGSTSTATAAADTTV